MELTDKHINSPFILVAHLITDESLTVTYLGKEHDEKRIGLKQCYLFGFNDFFDEEELIRFAQIEQDRVWSLDHLIRYQKQNVVNTKHLKPRKEKLFIWLEESELAFLVPFNELQQVVLSINNELNYGKKKV